MQELKTDTLMKWLSTLARQLLPNCLDLVTSVRSSDQRRTGAAYGCNQSFIALTATESAEWH
jgi:hypothetical protein